MLKNLIAGINETLAHNMTRLKRCISNVFSSVATGGNVANEANLEASVNNKLVNEMKRILKKGKEDGKIPSKPEDDADREKCILIQAFFECVAYLIIEEATTIGMKMIKLFTKTNADLSKYDMKPSDVGNVGDIIGGVGGIIDMFAM